MTTRLEHANFTVTDPDATAAWMCALFGWEIRWAGAGMTTGRTVHVGSGDQYLALFSYGDTQPKTADTHRQSGGLNHIALVVDDLDAMETAVKAQGFTPINHGDYEPGRRFYFLDHDGIEYELVNYA